MVKPAEAKISYELWFNEFMSFWEVCHNAPVWEMDMLWMMARLAMYTIGYIDWEPHMPLMFTRFLRSLDLPVSYKQRQSQKHHKLETTPMAVWIVAVIGGGSSALDHLQKFMQTIESYYHPANAGRWSIKLRELFRNIPFYFVQRLHRERYKEKSWGPEVPETHRLTEGDIDRFVEIMTPVVGHVVYSRQATSDVSSGLQHLATLRPAQVVPLVLDKLYATLDTVTEPHKLTACMQCVVAVARPLLQGPAHGYPEGPTHVIPLLTALLPGIDPNDIRKCLVTFQFISTFVSMIPLVDSSAAAELWSDLTDEEHAICEASAGLPDFVLQFFRRVFTLVQSSSLEVTRLEQVDSDKRSKLEAVAESALSSICNVIVMQTSERIFKSALRKLYDFVCENILETKVSGQMVAIMVKSFIRIRPEDTLRLFVPRLCSRVHELMDEGSHDVRDDETLDTELLYNLLILSEMLDCNGSALLPHVEQLTAVLDRTLHLACTQGYVMATRLLNHVLISLTFVQPLEYRSAPPPFYEGARDRLPVREWGAPGDIHDLRVTWYTPGPAEIQCAQHLVNRYLVPEMEDLNSFVDDRLTITREVMRRKLGIVVGCLGAQSVLPVWQEKACLQVPSRLDPWAFEMIIGTALTISLPDGGNVRKALAELAGRLQKKLLSCAEDDTKSFFNLIGIWDALIMTKYRGRDFESHWKNFHLVKKVLADCLRGGKQHLRPLLIDRVMLHQEFRTESRSFTFTDTHRHILHHLYQLSTSHYGEVRVRAQKKLFLAVSSFPYAYSALTPLIKTTLQMDCRSNHEEFKGCLYVLLGPKSTPIIARHDWTFVSEIWPCLVTSTPSEKPSVINLMNLMVDAVHKHFPTISIKLEIPERCLDAARVLTSLHISQREVDEGVLELERISALNEQLYGKVLDTLHGSVVSGNLHWRYHTMALSFIRDLVHPNVKYGANIVRYILAALVHDSLEIRKLAICIMVYILKQQKRPHKKVEIDPRGFTESTGGGPGVREDNLWVQYDRESRPRSSDEWDRPRFLHKVYSGFYVWPDTVQVYAPSSEQPCLDRPVDQLSAQEQEIDAFFSNQDNIDSLIRFMSLEEKKGRDKFNGGRFIMFKVGSDRRIGFDYVKHIG